MDNYTFNVYQKIEKAERSKWFLYIDAVYKADPTKKNLSAEVLSKLLGIKNQGGFEMIGFETSIKLQELEGKSIKESCVTLYQVLFSLYDK